jgi:alkanesulfonate monooxygenase SsuD/methylene tetrahydromethanopterin reductase-like flavin-dependent oxidoreductase (luciferase family)
MTTPWFGFHLPLYSYPDTPPERQFDRVVEQAKAAEAAGFSLVTVMDHLNQIPGVGSQTEPMLEAGPSSPRWPARRDGPARARSSPA